MKRGERDANQHSRHQRSMNRTTSSKRDGQSDRDRSFSVKCFAMRDPDDIGLPRCTVFIFNTGSHSKSSARKFESSFEMIDLALT